MALDPNSANFDGLSPSQSYGYLLDADSVTAEDTLLSQNIFFGFFDSVYRCELLIETSFDTQSTDANDRPMTPTVRSVPTSLLQPSPSSPPPPPPQVATFNRPRFHKIPQDLYHANRWNFAQLDSILFQVDDLPGVNMGEALRQNFAALQGRDDPVLQDAAMAISFRLWFSGYPLSGSQISTRCWDSGRNPINRSRLAYQIAKKLKNYLDLMRASHAVNPPADRGWEIGRIFLAKLVHVTQGSFQAEFWVMDDTT